MNKKLAKKINDFPIVEVCTFLFIILFLTIALVNVLMGGILIEEKFIKDVIDNVIKVF